VNGRRAFRFGIVAPAITSALALRELARAAEDLGYSSLLFIDHLGPQPAPLIAAMAAAAEASSLRVGTQVLANPFRNATILAKEITTLDLLSDGRFEAGLGAGWPADSPMGRSDGDQSGIAFGPSGRRVADLIDTVRLIRAFQASTARLDFTGTHLNLRNLAPFPAQGPRRRTPIMVGGAGPRVLRFAAREADIVNIAPRPPATGRTSAGAQAFGMTMSQVSQLLKDSAGERYAELELCVMSTARSASVPAVTDDPGSLLARLAQELNTTVEAAREMPTTLIGSVAQLGERIHEHRDRYDISYRTIPATAMRDFAPIVAALAGR
jgi:probable F420-dependent oxidoreductase